MGLFVDHLENMTQFDETEIKHFRFFRFLRGFVPDHSRHGYVLDVFIIATIPDYVICGKFPTAIPTCHAMLSSDETD